MGKIIEIGYCQKCGKPVRRDRLHVVEQLVMMTLCTKCYERYQRLQWGYW
ncbi:MAG TPA: hypothetical protein GXZ96_01560 [Firmicutes bacterium]|nr:hypothetical protein [Bacillota bacterium]